jgi:hypothetical protein
LGRGRVAVAETARWPPRSLGWPSGRVK